MRDSMEIDPLAACHVASLEPFDQWCSHFLYSECYSACGEFVQLFFYATWYKSGSTSNLYPKQNDSFPFQVK
jgi:hypothetical protein